MRFLDEMINNGMTLPSGCAVINADNVAEYLFTEMPEELDMLCDFPNIAPPFPHLAIEFLHPSHSIDTKTGERKSFNMPRFRNVYMSQHIEVTDVTSATSTLASFLQYVMKNSKCEAINVPFEDRFKAYQAAFAKRCPRWFSVVHLFHELAYYKSPIGKTALMSMYYFVNDDGSFLCNADNTDLPMYDMFAPDPFRKLANSSTMFTFWLTLSFLHCKNVELRDIPNSASFVRKELKWHKRPPIQYKELVIEPMRKVIRNIRHQHNIGPKKALHICRGHFKDYRQRGLFGKAQGIYWWNQMVRGKNTESVVEKSYKIKV